MTCIKEKKKKPPQCFLCLSLVPTLPLLLSLNQSRELAIWQSIPVFLLAFHPTSHLQRFQYTLGHRGVNYRDAVASGTIGHCRVGDHSRCLSLFLCCSLTQSSRRCSVSAHARALLRALWWSTLTKMYSYRSCLWRLSIFVVSVGKGQSWPVTRSGSRSTGQTINLSCVPADSWTYRSPNALFFKWAELTLAVQ